MMRTAAIAAAFCVGLLGCGKKDDAKPDGMPEGYVRVNKAFGVRMAGLAELEGLRQRAPVVEFRAGGDYAMYPVTTDCEGNFQRGAGLVFAADGTVREQVPEQAVETVAGSPQFAPLLDRICMPSRQALAAIKNDESHWRTRFGLVEITGDRGSQAVLLKKRQVASGSALAFVGAYPVGEADLVLLHERDLGTSCPGGEYSVLAVRRDSATTSRTFGNCTEGDPQVRVVDGALEITLPGQDGAVVYRYANGEVEGTDEFGSTSGFDPEAAYDAAAVEGDEGSATMEAANDAAAAANAAARAADAAAREVAVSEGRGERQWAQTCEAASRRVTTPAGSTVGLSADEARRYCGCVWRRASSEAAAITQRGEAGREPVSTVLPQAHAACLRDLM